MQIFHLLRPLCLAFSFLIAGTLSAQTTEIKGNGDQTAAIAKYIADMGPKGTLLLPKGYIQVSASLFTLTGAQRLTIRGAGKDQTILQLKNDLTEPLIVSKGQKGKMSSHLTVEDLTFDGEDHQADCFRIEGTMWANFTRVEFRRWKGHAIHGLFFWDTVFDDCYFDRCGDPNKQKAAVLLEPLDEKDNYTFCNNIMFTNCRWESNPYISVMLRKGSRKNRFIGCKFHSTLPDAQPYDHVVLDDADANVFTGTNFTHCGKSGLVLKNSHGNIISSNLIGSNKEYGIQLIDSHSNSIHANSFSPTFREQPNQLGAWVEEGKSTANSFEGNVGKLKADAAAESNAVVNNVLSGTGTPEGRIDAAAGTLFMSVDTKGAIRIYIKKGAAAKTGWVPLK